MMSLMISRRSVGALKYSFLPVPPHVIITNGARGSAEIPPGPKSRSLSSSPSRRGGGHMGFQRHGPGDAGGYRSRDGRPSGGGREGGGGRPPHRAGGGPPRQTRHPSPLASAPRSAPPLLRTHAVSIFHGDYTDDYDEEVEEEDSFPLEYGGLEDIMDDERFGYHEDGEEEADKADEVLAYQRAIEEEKTRWERNARPKVRVTEIDDRGRAYGRGSRKEASARVWIEPGLGHVVVNRMDLVDYFPRESDREMILSPLVASQTCGMFDVKCHVEGGGVTGKAGAIRLGLARALEKYNPEYRPPMKRLGYLTRDPRMVERKKVGRKKARKSPQWVRR